MSVALTIESAFGRFTDQGVSEDAETIRNWLSRLRSELYESMTFGREYGQTLDALREVCDECCVDNWDGYGAKPIEADSLDLALRFIQAFPQGLPAPDITVDPDGEICFEWAFGPRRAFSISFGTRGELTFAGVFGRNKAYGTEYFGDEIPPTILDNLDRLLRP